MIKLNKIIYKKFFLFSLVFYSLINFHFIRCEVNNLEITPACDYIKSEKSICTNRSVKNIPTRVQFLKTTFGFWIFLGVMFTVTDIYHEWREGRELSFSERQLEMINISLSALLTFEILRAFGGCSSQNSETAQPDPKIQEESACALQA